MRTAVLTISSSVARGATEDTSGGLLAEAAQDAGGEVVAHEVVSDDRTAIEDALRRLADEDECTFVFTTGGTGFTPDDVTPEATRAVIDRDAPGFAETMRAKSLEFTPLGILTRGVSGIRGKTLIVNFPGNPKAIGQLFGILAPTLEHVAATLHRDGGRPAGG